MDKKERDEFEERGSFYCRLCQKMFWNRGAVRVHISYNHTDALPITNLCIEKRDTLEHDSARIKGGSG